MRRSVILVFIVMISGGHAFAQCVPGANQVAIFENDTYGGTCRVLNAGSYPNPSAMGFPNDKMSSIKLGTGAQAIVCEHDNYSGTCELFTVSDSNFGDNAIRHDRASSMKAFAGPPPACNPAAYQVSLYDQPNYGAGICTTVGLGEYPNPTVMGFGNDMLSSIKVGTSAEVVLCSDVNYYGDCKLFTTYIADLGQSHIGNNKVSSIRVRPRGSADCVPQASQASLFMHAGFLAPCVVKGVMDYANAAAIGLPNDSISSLRVGAQVQVCACTGDSYKETCVTFTSDDDDLFGNAGVGNDTISSLKVQPRGAQCTAAPQGWREVQVTNCNFYQHIVTVWMRDVTPPSSGQWVRVGAQAPQFVGTACPATGSPLVVPLPEGRYTIVAAVDPLRPNCGGVNYPSLACTSLQTEALYGQSTGLISTLIVNY